MNDLPLTTVSSITYVSQPEELEQCLHHLQQAKAFAFDLEFDRDRYTYGFDLCLLQIATQSHCFVIDPMAGLNLEPLFKVFEQPGIRKLVHCPGEDLRLLHSLKCYPVNLVDTEVYARLLNYEQTSLSNMLNLKCGVTLNKKLQTSNWNRRPLKPEQIEYAAADVLYLFQLEEALLPEAEKAGLMDMIDEEFVLLNKVRYQIDQRDNFLKKNDLQFMSPYDQYILNELFRFRDALAQKMNKPAHQVMPEILVRGIAYNKIDLQHWMLQEGMHPRLRNEQFQIKLERLMAALHATAKEKQLPRKRQGSGLTDEERKMFEDRKANAERVKTTVFVPIQQQITARFGEFTMRYILSSTLVNDIVRGDSKLADIKAAYRRKIIADAADSLGFDISAY